MIKFVNNSEPDITDENLNKMQQDIGTVVSATEPQGDERLRVWIKKGKNLFNKKNVVTGQLEGDGSITYTSQYYTSDFISINPETSYYKTSTNSARLKFYDKDKKPLTSKYDDIENANTSTEFVSPTNAYYLRLTLNPSYIDTLQIEQGTSATSYEAYIEPEIYVLNNNGVYEEYTKKYEETYSKKEKKIGYWINGKPLYRKVIKTTTPTVETNGTDVWKQETIQNVDFGFITDVFYIKDTTSTTMYQNIQWHGYEKNRIRCNFLRNKNTNKGIVEIVSNNTLYNNLEVIVIVEYTKTAD